MGSGPSLLETLFSSDPQHISCQPQTAHRTTQRGLQYTLCQLTLYKYSNKQQFKSVYSVATFGYALYLILLTFKGNIWCLYTNLYLKRTTKEYVKSLSTACQVTTASNITILPKHCIFSALSFDNTTHLQALLWLCMSSH